VFFNPAANSVLPAVAGDDNLVGANSAIWSAAVVSQIALAPLAGLLVAGAGAGPAFAINAVSFLISAALLARIRVPRPLVAPRRSRLADITDGLAYIKGSRLLSTLGVVQGLAALSAGATSALLVVLAERHLHLGATRFGVLLAAIGVGAGIGPLVLGRVTRDMKHPALLYGPYLLRGLVDLALAAFASFAGALVALGAYGLGTSTGNVTYNTILQSVVPDQRRERVFAFYDVVWQTGRLAWVSAASWPTPVGSPPSTTSAEPSSSPPPPSTSPSSDGLTCTNSPFAPEPGPQEATDSTGRALDPPVRLVARTVAEPDPRLPPAEVANNRSPVPGNVSAQTFVRVLFYELCQQGLDALGDVVSDGPHLVDRFAGRVGQVPVQVPFARVDRAGVAAAHGDNHLRRPGGLAGERLPPAVWMASSGSAPASRPEGADHPNHTVLTRRLHAYLAGRIACDSTLTLPCASGCGPSGPGFSERHRRWGRPAPAPQAQAA